MGLSLDGREALAPPTGDNRTQERVLRADKRTN